MTPAATLPQPDGPVHQVNTKAVTPAAAVAADGAAKDHSNIPASFQRRNSSHTGNVRHFNAQAIVAANKGASGNGAGKTFAGQDNLPKLPIPKLEDTCKRYLQCLQPLQEPDDHEQTKKVVEDFLQKDGPKLHANLQEYAKNKPSYISEFWDESYLQSSDSVVLSLNPFFILE